MADFLDPRGFVNWQDWANEVQQQGFVTIADVLNLLGNGATPVWGTITGTLASQTDLQTALNGKQPIDADLTAIAALAGTSGFLKKTATDTWALDTATYITGNQTITLSGDISGSGATAITTAIGANKVTNAMLAQVATATFKGRTTAATGNVEDLTVAQATALLNTFTTSLKGLAPASGGGTTNFLRADGTWAAPVGTTNLSYTASTRVLASDTGTDATLPLFTSTDPGLAPLSGGGTTNFLRADGTWAAPSVGGAAWGAITGTLSSQTDLNTALNERLLDTSDTMTGTLTFNDGVAANTKMELSGVQGFIFKPTTTTGGWARGVRIQKFSDNTELGGAGFYGSAEALTSYSVGFGAAWWSSNAAFTVSAAGNVSIGAFTPSATQAAYRTIELGSAGNGIFGWTSGKGVWVMSNTYYDGSWRHATTGEAWRMDFATGASDAVKIFRSASATAGTATTDSTLLTINNSGHLLLGTAGVDDGGLLTLSGANTFAGNGLALYETTSGGSNRLRIYQTTGSTIYNSTYGTGSNRHEFQVGNVARAYIGGSSSITALSDSQTGYSSAAIQAYSASGNVIITWHAGGSSADYVKHVRGAQGLHFMASNDTYATPLIASDFQIPSDARLKDQVRDFGDPMGIVRALHGKRFRIIDRDKQSLGFIAQDFQKVLPELVNEAENLLSINYAPVVAVHNEALKQIDARLARLEAAWQ